MELCFKQTAISTDTVFKKSVRQYFLGIMQKTGVLFSWIRKVGDSSSSASEQGEKDCRASGNDPKISKDKQNEYLRGILDKHGNRILRLAYSYVHNMEDSEEILQDVLLKLIDQAPAFESAEHEKAWILRVTANLSKNRIEYNKLRDTDELNEELVAENREDLSFIWEAVKSLPENYREVIHLFYEEGYQTEEIAGILGESGANIRTRLKRAREKLKEILKEEYDFDE
jgi:RNA polymerase sigma-70 factor (ECF subfamily)